MNEGPTESGGEKGAQIEVQKEKDSQERAKKDAPDKTDVTSGKKAELHGEKGAADSLQGQKGDKPGEYKDQDKSKEGTAKDSIDNKGSDSRNALNALLKRPDVTLRREISDINELKGNEPRRADVTLSGSDNSKIKSGGDQTQLIGDRTQLKGFSAKDEISGSDIKTSSTDQKYRTISQDGVYEVVKDLDYNPVFKDGKFEDPNSENKIMSSKEGESDNKPLERKNLLHQAKEDPSTRTKDREARAGSPTEKDFELKTKDSRSDAKEALSEFEIIERNRVAPIYEAKDFDPGIRDKQTSELATAAAFRHDEHEVTPDQSQKLENEMPRIVSALDNPGAIIILCGFTDGTGTSEYNDKLSGRRVDSVKRELVEKYGIDEERIQTRARGEVVSRDGEESNADHRVVTIDIRYEKLEITEDVDNKFKETEKFNDAIEKGEKIKTGILDKHIEETKERFHLDPKLYLDNPSDDPIEFAKQVYNLAKDVLIALKEAGRDANPTKLIVLMIKAGADGINDFVSGMFVPQIKEARSRDYDVAIAGMASGVFNDHIEDTSSYSPREMTRYQLVKEEFGKLSDLEKFQVKASVIAGKTFEFTPFTNRERFENHFNVTMFIRYAGNYFNKSEYSYR